MYPELEEAGGLSNALNLEFEKINSVLKVATDDALHQLPFSYARIQKDGKFSQIYIAAEKKLYLPDFWRDGVCLAHAQTESISDLAAVVDYWLNQDVSTQELADKYSFVRPNPNAAAFDQNNEVEQTWNNILQDESRADLRDFIQLAINDNVLNKLFPFTSLYTLCFSRCTGYPYDTDNLPNVTPKAFEFYAPHNGIKSSMQKDCLNSDTQFVVTKNRNEYLGEGNAETALKIVKANLPDNIRPATRGTADD